MVTWGFSSRLHLELRVEMFDLISSTCGFFHLCNKWHSQTWWYLLPISLKRWGIIGKVLQRVIKGFKQAFIHLFSVKVWDICDVYGKIHSSHYWFIHFFIFLFWISMSGPSISFSILCALSLISSPSNVLEGLVDVCGHANRFCRGFLAWCFSCNSAESSLNGPSWLFHYPTSYLQCWKCWTTPDEIWLELARHTVFLNHKCENYCVVCLSDVKGCGCDCDCYPIHIPGAHPDDPTFLMLLSMDKLHLYCR